MKISDDEIVDKVFQCMGVGGTAFGIPPHEWTDLVLDWLVNNIDLGSHHYTFLFSREVCMSSLPGRVRARMVDYVRNLIDNADRDSIEQWGVSHES